MPALGIRCIGRGTARASLPPEGLLWRVRRRKVARPTDVLSFLTPVSVTEADGDIFQKNVTTPSRRALV